MSLTREEPQVFHGYRLLRIDAAGAQSMLLYIAPGFHAPSTPAHGGSHETKPTATSSPHRQKPLRTLLSASICRRKQLLSNHSRPRRANGLLPELILTPRELRSSPCHRHRSSPSHHHPLEIVRPRWPPRRSTRRNSEIARSGSGKLSKANPHSTKSKEAVWKPSPSASMKQAAAFRTPRRAISSLRRPIIACERSIPTTRPCNPTR